ncbi:MAG: hypothetical protein R6V02_11355 [Candidatus Aminicenantes bacterium]
MGEKIAIKIKIEKMKNVPFDLSLKTMHIADKKEIAKTSQFFYE